MVVAHYPFPIVGGLEKQAHELSKSLVNKNIDVLVLSTKFSPSQGDVELIDGVTVHRMSWYKSRFIRFTTLPFKIISFMLRNRNLFSIVHLHTLSWFSLYVLLLAKVINKKTVLKMANVGEYGLPPLKKTFIGRLQLRVIKISDVIVAMSSESKKEVCSIGYPIGNIFMTPNGISIPDNIHYTPTNVSNKCKVIFVGRLDEQKNIESLLQIWASLQACNEISAKLEICGTGPLEEKLKAMAVQLNIADTVIFKGHIKNVYKYLSRADIFILPSMAEGNSNAILEAMVSGLPIVSTNVGGTLMQVGDHGKAYISEVNNNNELLSNLIALIGSGEQRERVGREMYNRARDVFSMEVISNRYIDMYSYVNSDKCCKVYKISNKVFD